jgi:ribose 5-phosphate isomerase A
MSVNAKKDCAQAAVELISQEVPIIGVGTGSTVNFFIEALAHKKQYIEGCVASSVATEKLLRQFNIPVLDLNAVGTQVGIYVDGADEINSHGQMLKGLGGALAREKIIASAAKRRICIAEKKKLVNLLGITVPVVLEVMPIARSLVARALVAMNANPVYRQGYLTDNGNIILDVYKLDLTKPQTLEDELKLIPGVIDSGIFAKVTAHEAFLADNSTVDHKIF